MAGARESRRYLLVLSKEMLDTPSQERGLKPGLFPYGTWQGSRGGIFVDQALV